MEANTGLGNERSTASRLQKEKETDQRKDCAVEESDLKETKTEGVALPPNLMKAIRRRSSSIIGSNSSNSGNNSDNSGLVSIGNNSFGFNFDAEEGMNNSNSEGDGKSDSGEDTTTPKIGVTNDSAHGSETSEEGRKPQAMTGVTIRSEANRKGGESSSGSDWKSSVSSLTQSSGSGSNITDRTSHHAAAAAVVANLHSIASQHATNAKSSDGKCRDCHGSRDFVFGRECLTMMFVTTL